MSEAMLEMASRMGAVEQGLKDKPSSNDVQRSLNELGRDFRSAMGQMETHFREMLAADRAEAEKRTTAMQLQLTNGFQAMAESAATKAIDKQRADEQKARQDIENKAKDAVRGMRLMMWAGGPVGGMVLLAAVYSAGRFVLHWWS